MRRISSTLIAPSLAALAAVAALTLLPETSQAQASAKKVAAISPFFCDEAAFDDARRKRHFDVLLPVLREKRTAVRELRDGYEFDFPSDAATYALLTEMIEGERLCCPFFDISMRVAPEHGPLTMRLTGRPGTKEFIKVDATNWTVPPVAAK